MVAEPVFDYAGEYDENWPLPEHLTIAQYHRVIFRPDAHFVDGVIVRRDLGDSVHGHAIGCLIAALDESCKQLGVHSCISLRLQTAPSRIRVCDFVLLRADAPREDVPTIAPLLCIEVLAPGQIPNTELESLADYLTMGVPNIWMIDPIRRCAWTLDAQGLHEADPTRLVVIGTQIHLDLTEAFAAID